MQASVIQALKDTIGAEIVHDDAASLRERRFDRWSVNHCRDYLGQELPQPGCVVRPRSVEQVQQIMRFASANSVAVMPYGSGSGVCGGVVGNPETILIDMGEMNRVREIDAVNLIASFDAGLNGLAAEEAVAAQGLTTGHWPQSIGISTVGGWVSTRASGQFSSAYGNIEDMIYSIEAVLPNGELVNLGKAPRASAGPDLRHILMGAEGTMGIVTGVTLSLRRAAEHREFTAFYADTMAQGFETQRRIYQAEWHPPVMRQYDAPEVNRLFTAHARGDACLLIMVHEGPRSRVEAELAAVRQIAAEAGLSEASADAARGWIEKRNHVPEWSDLLKLGVIADTIEISGKWSQIDRIYADVMAALRSVPSIVNASAHSSHVYRSGINIYCTFACRPADGADMEGLYFEAWDKALEACAAAGGGIAHHHGSGRLRRGYIHHDLGQSGVDLLRTIKAAVDPQGLLNPGNLLPEE